MNRVAAIQKSSRTITIAWTCSPSHCRNAATSSVSSSPRRANSHCSNWSRTSRTFWPGRTTRPRRSAAIESTRCQLGGQVRTGLAQRPAAAAASVSSGVASMYTGQHVLAQPGQQARLDQRRLAAARGAVDQPDLEGGVGVGGFDPGLPEPEALGQAVAVAGAGQELQEEVGVVAVERPQALGDDLDGRGRRSRAARGGGAVASAGRARRRATAPGAVAGSPDAASAWRKCRRSSARSRAVLYRSDARLASIFMADPLQLPGDRVVDLPGRARLGGGDLLEDLGVRRRPGTASGRSAARRRRRPG